MARGKPSPLTPTQVKRMLDFAEETNSRDHLLLLTMVLMGLTRGEITGRESSTNWKIYAFTRAKNKEENLVREKIIQRLQNGEPTVDHEGATFQLTNKGRFVRRTKPEPSLPGLLIENLRDDRTILVTEGRGLPPRLLVLDPYLFEKYKKYIGDRKEGRIFEIISDWVLKITKKYGRLADIPFVNTQMLHDFYTGYRLTLPGVLGITPYSEEYIEARIREGENEEVEWKFTIGNTSDFCETMVSFANRIGGTILIGVDDDGNVQGVPENLQEIEKKITNINHEYCDPRVSFSVTIVNVQRKPVAVVQVKEGFDKPYWMKDKGFVIRNGSTDRIMKRSEVISLIFNKEQRRESDS